MSIEIAASASSPASSNSQLSGFQDASTVADVDLSGVVTPVSVPATSAPVEQQVALAGTQVGDRLVVVSTAAAQAGLYLRGARVTAAGQINLTYVNYGSAAIVPTSATFRVLARRDGQTLG